VTFSPSIRLMMLLLVTKAFIFGQAQLLHGPSPVPAAPARPSSQTVQKSAPLAATHATAEAASATPVSLTVAFKGTNATGAYPADPSFAVGPSSLLIVGNSTVTIQDKTGKIIDGLDPLTFFNGVRQAGENAGDARAIYDRGSQRFFVSAQGRIINANCGPGTCVSHLFLAVSKSANPSTVGSADWHFYSFDGTLDGSTPTAFWADFPALGANDQALIVSFNAVSFSTGLTQYGKLRILDKAKLVQGQPVSWTDIVKLKDPLNGGLVTNLQPAIHVDASATFFVLSPSSAVSCGLIVWGINNALDSATIVSSTAQASG
jgi:hypothetical protein